MANPKNKPQKSAPVKPVAATNSAKYSDNTVLLFILLATAAVFSNSVFNDFIINWDDDGYIISNPLIKEFSLNGLKTIFTVPHLDNYHPLTTLSNAVELNLFGLNPKPYHFFNLLLHLLNTFLVFRFIKSLCGRMEVAAITALLFGIHPMHVESVSWIAERKDVLYSFFFLGSLICYLRYLKDKKAAYFTYALLLFICSLLSKPAAVALAPALLLLDYYMGRKTDLKSITEKVPFFALAIFFGILAMHIQQASGSIALAPHFAVAHRVFLASYALLFYIVKAVAPFGLSALHLYPDDHNLSWMYYCAPVVLCLIGWGIYKAGKYRKDLLFGTLFFLITIALVIQVIPVGRAIVGERYTYIPYIGLFFIVGKFYCWIVDDTLSFASAIKPCLLPVLTGFVLLFATLTWARNNDWKDSHTLFTSAIEASPRDYYGYFARATGESLVNDKLNALDDVNKVISMKPGYADAYYLRGVLREQTMPADAMEDYTKAIHAAPGHDKAYYNRGNLKIYAKDYKGALKDYDSTVKYNPKNAEAFCNRGAAKAGMGDVTEAVKDYDEAIAINPALANAYYNRGGARITLGDKAKACADFHEALALGYAAAQKQIDQYCK